MKMATGLLVMLSLIAWLSPMAQALQFELESGHTKCISEEIKANSMTVGKYSVVNPNDGFPLPDTHRISVRVTSLNGNTFHTAENIPSGQFAFATVEAGDYMTCIWVAAHTSPIKLTVDFDWKYGVAARDWTSVAKKNSIESMEMELKHLFAVVKTIQDEMLYLRQREEEMQELNRSTNSKMGWMSILSLIICLSVAGSQVWHLKNFFQKKKLI